MIICMNLPFLLFCIEMHFIYCLYCHALSLILRRYRCKNNVLGNVDAGEMMSYLDNGDMEGYTQFIQDNSAAMAGAAIF